MRAGVVRRRLAAGGWQPTAGRALTAVARPLRYHGGLWRPSRSRAFWVTVGLVTLIWSGHYAAEAFHPLRHGDPFTFLLESLFLIPVVYAALNFGLRGAAATAVACTLITLPNWVLFHSGAERVSVITQMAIVYTVAMFVGHRVNREQSARTTAEGALQALNVTATKYQALFETSGDGILVVDERDAIVQCNAAAEDLLGLPVGALLDRTMAEVLPAELASKLAECVSPRDEQTAPPPGQAVSSGCAEALLARADGQDVWLEPVCTALPGAGGLTQVILRDVTEQKHRQASLESYAAAILRAQEEERRRIAQELHDDTVQSLVLLVRRIDAIDEEGATADEPRRRRLAELRVVVESAMESLRAFIHGLRPSTLDDLGLTPAIRRLVTELDSGSGMSAKFVVHGNGRRLLPDHELALYRIAQEGLRNVERHSEASRATVTLHYRPQRVELSISDDGVGFVVPSAPAHATADGKLGMLGMRERARIVGGTLEIHSQPGAGTTVIAAVPADRQLNEAASLPSGPGPGRG